MGLRPYQSKAREWVEDTLPTLPRPSAVVQLPTGGGKTTIIEALQPDLVLAPGRDLTRQLQGRLPGVQCVNIEALTARLRKGERLPLARRVCLDEARWVASPSGSRIWQHFLDAGAELVLFDATPCTPRGQGLGQWADALYQAAQVRELIEGGYLVPWRVLAPAEAQRDLAMDPVEAYQRFTPGQSCIVFAENKAHAGQIQAGFERAGIKAAVITDDTPHASRAALIAGLETGEIKVAVCAQILRQGIDVPRVSSILMARAAVSESLWLQAIGRGGRPFPGKERCMVLDLRGCWHAHGLPDAPRIWSLQGEAVRLLDPLTPCVQCRSCLGWVEYRNPCADCGAVLPPPPPPKVRAADLIEVRKLEPDPEKQAHLGKLVREALSKKYHPGWAKHRYAGKYGSQPPDEWYRSAVYDARELRAPL